MDTQHYPSPATPPPPFATFAFASSASPPSSQSTPVRTTSPLTSSTSTSAHVNKPSVKWDATHMHHTTTPAATASGSTPASQQHQSSSPSSSSSSQSTTLQPSIIPLHGKSSKFHIAEHVVNIDASTFLSHNTIANYNRELRADVNVNRLIAVNHDYICYQVKNSYIRCIHQHTGCNTL